MTRFTTFLLCLIVVPRTLHAQPAPTSGPRRFTFEEALRYASDHYPAIAAAAARVEASRANGDVARAAVLPRLDAVWQSNRATANNVVGLTLPQSVIPPISGPPLPESSRSVWGSAAGLLVGWEALDFGLRAAGIARADAALAETQANVRATTLEVQSAAGVAFLALASAEQQVAAAQADLSRRDTLAQAVHVLADNQLRPGAEASRADAERAAAATRLIQSRQRVIAAQALLARALGLTSALPQIDASALLASSGPGPAATPTAVAHAVVQAREAAVAVARADEALLARNDRPRVLLQSSLFARGTGISADGRFESGAGGLGLERANWAAGVQVVFPNLFGFASLRARKAAAAATTRLELSRVDEARLVVSTEQQSAKAMTDAARAVAANTPVQLAAAQVSESQARARYEAGLAAINEVADAQGLLARAEYIDRMARLDIWRALLAEAVAAGDLAPLMTPTGGGDVR